MDKIHVGQIMVLVLTKIFKIEIRLKSCILESPVNLEFLNIGMVLGIARRGVLQNRCPNGSAITALLVSIPSVWK